MKPSRQEVLANFKRECPAELLECYTDEGLNMMLDNIEEAERIDDVEFDVTPIYLNHQYCEESLAECLSLQVEPKKPQHLLKPSVGAFLCLIQV